jgi:hypothetical protein
MSGGGGGKFMSCDDFWRANQGEMSVFQELMKDPVILLDSGESFEREHIEEWLKTNRWGLSLLGLWLGRS